MLRTSFSKANGETRSKLDSEKNVFISVIGITEQKLLFISYSVTYDSNEG